MKRLYAEVAVAQSPDGYGVALDGRLVKMPGGGPLLLPTRLLAEAIAQEWREQGAQVRPDAMLLTQLAGTVRGTVATGRAAVEEATLRLTETDLVCYRADQPPALINLQRAAWDPLLDWLESRIGIRLAVTAGIVPIVQAPSVATGLARLVRATDDWRLGALRAAASVSGSFVIALALIERHISADEAFRAAELDQRFEIDHWGSDPEADVRLARIASDLKAARRFDELSRADVDG